VEGVTFTEAKLFGSLVFSVLEMRADGTKSSQFWSKSEVAIALNLKIDQILKRHRRAVC
jgi:hypothetical protein